MKREYNNWLVAAALVVTAVLWRVVNWRTGWAPNLEIVTASTLVAAYFGGALYGRALIRFIAGAYDGILARAARARADA